MSNSSNGQEEEYEEDYEEEAEMPDEEGNKVVEEEMHEIDAIMDVQDKTFEEIRLPADVVSEVQGTWNAYMSSASSRVAAGEAIYAALFDSAPSLQSLFKTPRAVMAIRIMAGLNNIVGAVHEPGPLKMIVETLGFQHLDMQVTIPRVIIFRDALVDLFELELGDRFSSKARSGWRSILNYVGGAYIYICREYAGRLKIIASSWRTATNKERDIMDVVNDEGADSAEQDGDGEGQAGSMQTSGEAKPGNGPQASGEAVKVNSMQVPTTFNEMFLFNGAVMGFGGSLWMQEVLESFDAMVTNCSNTYRLQEECDTLSLNIDKYRSTVNLNEYKAVMLASLRSLVPKDWNSAHEVAWTWLWDNIARMLKSLLGKAAARNKGLERFLMSLTEDSRDYLRRESYRRIFALAPASQDYFKQSTTRLYFIADKVVEMTIEMYRDPKKMVEDISALGLRHVGYGIPTEFFAPFVSGNVEVIRSMTTDADAEDGFRWSLSLISRILVRTINEGSTIVMKAINSNSARQLEKAVACAPRGKRSMWLLNITVGTQSISPLYWSIESGSLESAKAMIRDLLIIRADRDNYYYGADDLIARHPDVIERLCADAQALLPGLLDGLIWRSRLTQDGQRRVNFYIKHLVQDADGNFNQCLDWLVAAGDPKIMCHPVVVLFTDLVWGGIANRFFMLSKCWFLFTLGLFIVSQSVLQHFPESSATRTSTMAIRCFIYVASLGRILHMQLSEAIGDCRAGRYIRLSGGIRIPQYLGMGKNAVNFLLMLCLMVMLAEEPIIWCAAKYNPDDPASTAAVAAASGAATSSLAASGTAGYSRTGPEVATVVVNHNANLFTQHCTDGEVNLQVYEPVSMVAMLLYWTLIVDLSVLSTRISAFVLVCGRTVSELGLFLLAIAYLIVAFATAISSLNQEHPDFQGIPKSMGTLAELSLAMYPTGHYAALLETPIILFVVACFIILGSVFLLNLLIAQLNAAYAAVYADMVGYARLDRGKIINETMAGVSNTRWSRWLASRMFDERLEYNEGDVGVAGGLQLLEAANANPINEDMIRRFGGSTSPAMQWPEENADADESDKFDRLEKVLHRATQKLGAVTKRGGKAGGSSSRGGQSGSSRSESSVGGSEAAGSV
ncbi:unnamed protein product [Polarella glacialis]|uniref:Globin domain-containing protein n=1 Tax=Polarella glacialis TaxID=89957 RepID=A0A813GBM3_POLGL|nr:unnamed protein product [Polarella glacialis]